MAERRMLAIRVIDDDAFLDLPSGARLLYYDLSMRADDDGFITPKKVMRLIGASQKDLVALIEAGFLISFESGVVAITHWRANNTIRKDRYNPTVYQEEFSQLTVNNGRYERYEDSGRQPMVDEVSISTEERGNQLATNGKPSGNPGQDSIGKVREEENVSPKGHDMREEGGNHLGNRPVSPVVSPIPTRSEIFEFSRSNGLAVDIDDFLRCYNRLGWKVNDEPIRDWRKVFLGWARNGTSHKGKGLQSSGSMGRDSPERLPDGVYTL